MLSVSVRKLLKEGGATHWLYTPLPKAVWCVDETFALYHSKRWVKVKKKANPCFQLWFVQLTLLVVHVTVLRALLNTLGILWYC